MDILETISFRNLKCFIKKDDVYYCKEGNVYQLSHIMQKIFKMPKYILFRNLIDLDIVFSVDMVDYLQISSNFIGLQPINLDDAQLQLIEDAFLNKVYQIHFSTREYKDVNLTLKYQVYKNDELINSFKTKSDARDCILNCIKQQLNGYNPRFTKFSII
jgi:hypothetical protein